MDLELRDHWRRVLPALDSKRPMAPHEVDELYAARERTASDDIAGSLLVAEPGTAPKLILCGSRGSGKTTELTRVGQLVGRDYCTIQLDLSTALPEGAGSVPIVLLFGLAGLRTLDDWSAEPSSTAGKKAAAALEPGRAGLQKAADAFTGAGKPAVDVGQLTKAVGTVMLGVPLAEAAAGGAMVRLAGTAIEVFGRTAGLAGKALTAVQALRDVGRGPLGRPVGTDEMEPARALVAAVNVILQDVAEASGRSPLLLADGLDKKTDVGDVLTALGDPGVLDGVDAAFVLSGPVNLRHDPRFIGLRSRFELPISYNLPMRVAEPTAGEDEPAEDPHSVEVLRNLLQRRAAHFALPPDVIEDSDAVRCALTSSGIIRDFLDLLHSAALHAFRRGRRQVSSDDVTAAIRDLRHTLELTLNTRRVKLLRDVLRTGQLGGDEELYDLLFENYVVCYPDGDLWFRPHEVLVDYLRRATL